VFTVTANAQPLHPDALTWAGLLGQWLDFARASVALPDDAEGRRWIIDYKTSSHEGGDRKDFLDREVERYRRQLERYADLLSGLYPGQPIALGLYFPLLDGWRSWRYSDASGI
jgi:hypothetical protein